MLFLFRKSVADEWRRTFRSECIDIRRLFLSVHVLRSRFRIDVVDLKPTLVLGCPVKPISPYHKSSTKNMITLGRFVFSERDDEMKRERSTIVSRFLISFDFFEFFFLW